MMMTAREVLFFWHLNFLLNYSTRWTLGQVNSQKDASTYMGPQRMELNGKIKVLASLERHIYNFRIIVGRGDVDVIHTLSF